MTPMSTEDSEPPSTVSTLHLSSVIRRPLVDRRGDRLGRVEDLIVRVGESPHPPIGGAIVRIGGRELFVPIGSLDGLDRGRVRYQGEQVDLRRFERRPGELLLAKDLQTRHLISLVGARLIRANEIELACIDGRWEVVGVDPSSRPVLRRILPRVLGRRIRPGALVDWATIEPFVAHVPTARLRIPYRKLARLHPAQIADLVEAASHDEGEEIIEAVKQDSELEADVFEELDVEHQLEFIRSRSDAEAARLIGTMAPDDAADLIVDLEQERRLPVLDLLPLAQQQKVRSLLSYNPETAGGLMSPDFLCLAEPSLVAEVIDAVRHSSAPPEALNVIFAEDTDGRLTGTASIVSLIRADPRITLGSVMRRDPVVVHTDADVHAIVRKMSDYNLTVAPVVDDDNRMIGVVTVDDVMELLMPTGWRRDFGMTTAEE